MYLPAEKEEEVRKRSRIVKIPRRSIGKVVKHVIDLCLLAGHEEIEREGDHDCKRSDNQHLQEARSMRVEPRDALAEEIDLVNEEDEQGAKETSETAKQEECKQLEIIVRKSIKASCEQLENLCKTPIMNNSTEEQEHTSGSKQMNDKRSAN